MSPAALAPEVLAALGRVPVTTPADARLFVRLAFRALWDGPLGNGYTPAELAASRPVLAEGLGVVGWSLMTGQWPAGGGLCRDVRKAADLVGPYTQEVTGVVAAAWGVFQLVTAVECLASARGDPAILGDAAAHAIHAADLAARSGDDGYSEESVRFLAALAAGTFGVQVPGRAASLGEPGA